MIMKHILTILLEKFLLLLVQLGQRVLGDGPEVVVEDHLAEDGVTSEEPADLSIITETVSQEDHVWLRLNRSSKNYFEKDLDTFQWRIDLLQNENVVTKTLNGRQMN